MDINKKKERYVLVHHHIFKNAGTSFNFALKKNFGQNFSEYDLPNSKIITSNNLHKYLEEKKNLNAVSGHHICLIPADSNQKIKCLSSILIRDPLARVRSIYNFERLQDAETDGAIMAKKFSFKDFVSWRLKNAPQVFCNYQTLYCSRVGPASHKRSLSDNDLNLAIQNLERCIAVGTVKRYKEFLVMAQHELTVYFPDLFLEHHHLNISSSSKQLEGKKIKDINLISDLGEDIYNVLKNKNTLDFKLYDFANQILDNWNSG